MNTLRRSPPGTSIFRHVALSMSSMFNSVGLLVVFPFSNTLYPLLMELLHMVTIVSIPTALFALWALRRRISPLALPPMKLFCPDDNRTGTMILTLRLNHLQLLPLRLHHHLLLHRHLPALALVHHHLMPPLYHHFQVPPLLHRGLHLPVVLLPPPLPQLWIAHTNDLSTAAASYMVIYGKLHDTGLLHRHRLRLTPMRSPHHLLLRLPRECQVAASLFYVFDSGECPKQCPLSVTYLHSGQYVTHCTPFLWSQLILPSPLPFSSQFTILFFSVSVRLLLIVHPA